MSGYETYMIRSLSQEFSQTFVDKVIGPPSKERVANCAIGEKILAMARTRAGEQSSDLAKIYAQREHEVISGKRGNYWRAPSNPSQSDTAYKPPMDPSKAAPTSSDLLDLADRLIHKCTRVVDSGQERLLQARSSRFLVVEKALFSANCALSPPQRAQLTATGAIFVKEPQAGSATDSKSTGETDTSRLEHTSLRKSEDSSTSSGSSFASDLTFNFTLDTVGDMQAESVEKPEEKAVGWSSAALTETSLPSEANSTTPHLRDVGIQTDPVTILDSDPAPGPSKGRDNQSGQKSCCHIS